MTSHASAVRRYFDTDDYLRNKCLLPIRARLVHELVGDIRNCQVLDLGGGDGTISRQFVANNRVTLVDLSAAMLDRARRTLGSRARYVQVDALRWRPDHLYDVVLCIGIVAHVESPTRLVAQLAAVTRPGGRCVIQVTDAGRPLGWMLSRYARVRRPHGYPLKRTTAKDLIEIAAAYQLDAVAERRYGLLIPGTGRLPPGLRTRLEERFASKPLSRIASDALILLERR
jgi:2-polyprenyl-3-methyl-5-hydroxy-6-metoxy-1,4-benzoquinol methylase